MSVTFNPILDGIVYRTTDGTWAEMRDGEGEAHDDTDKYLEANLGTTGDTDEYTIMFRSILLFDLSELPSDITISGIKLRLYCYDKTNDFVGAVVPTWNIYLATPASDVGLVNADYGEIGTSPLATALGHGDMTEGEYTEFIFNETGIAYIESQLLGDGIIRLGLREATYDAANIPPAWEGFKVYKAIFYTVDWTPKPQLVITATSNTTVRTDGATDIAATTATLNGTLIGDGGDTTTDCNFEWGETTAYGTTTATDSKSSGESFSKGITGLVSGTTYHYRAKASNDYDTVYGADKILVAGSIEYPTVALTRVTNLIHIFDRIKGINRLEISLGEVTTDFIEPTVIQNKRLIDTIDRVVSDRYAVLYEELMGYF